MAMSVRLDILIYGHDGRGLGHVSRSVAIGMALRRLYPQLKVCLLTGCAQTQQLIGEASLDWLKLPAYDTEVIDGKSSGIDGPSGFSDAELGSLRAEQITQIVRQYRPRLILIDHSPQGKHRELVPALQASEKDGLTWILGVRGVVGSVAQLSSDLADELFQRFYSGLLWYGDATILGRSQLDELARRFGLLPQECGYVSRLSEMLPSRPVGGTRREGCTISIPWFSEQTRIFFNKLVEAMVLVGPVFGHFRVFVGGSDLGMAREALQDLDFCFAEPFGDPYMQALYSSRSSVILGGYNSLADVLSASIPALVVLRDMRDREQQDHLTALTGALAGRLAVVEENDCSVEQLAAELERLMRFGVDPLDNPVNLRGAQRSAEILAALL
jgi:predicted glycosyltransferase